MVKDHVPSCPVSCNWRGEKAKFHIYSIHVPEGDIALLEKHGFKQGAAGAYWKADLMPDQVRELSSRFKPGSLMCDCCCFSPVFSEAGNIENNKDRTRRELAEGWPPGKTSDCPSEYVATGPSLVGNIWNAGERLRLWIEDKTGVTGRKHYEYC